jgi:hypothetical protein
MGTQHPLLLPELDQPHDLVYGDIEGKGEGTPRRAVAALITVGYLLTAFVLYGLYKIPVDRCSIDSLHRLPLLNG